MMLPKSKTERNPKYLVWIRKQPCCVCRRIGNIQAHHSSGGGIGIKGSDLEAVPLCFACHRKVHEGRKDNIIGLRGIIERLQKEYSNTQPEEP